MLCGICNKCLCAVCETKIKERNCLFHITYRLSNRKHVILPVDTRGLVSQDNSNHLVIIPLFTPITLNCDVFTVTI